MGRLEKWLEWDVSGVTRIIVLVENRLRDSIDVSGVPVVVRGVQLGVAAVPVQFNSNPVGTQEAVVLQHYTCGADVTTVLNRVTATLLNEDIIADAHNPGVLLLKSDIILSPRGNNARRSTGVGSWSHA